MPALTRRRDPDARHDCWHVYYGDIHVGTIGLRAGVPTSVDQWGWSCGLYPGLHSGQHRYGSAKTLVEALAGFKADWQGLLPNIPEGAFDECRRKRAFHAGKDEMWASGCRLPTQEKNGRSVCFCGIVVETDAMDSHVFTAHMAA